jgi:hypothetical protein
MDFKAERDLRDTVSYLPIAWHEGQGSAFNGKSPQEYAVMVTTAHVVSDEARLSLHRWVDAARRAGLSWVEIGSLIGITKQAAQQRFGGGNAAEGVGDQAEHVRTATAFNEEAIMAEEGRAGRELVAIGLLTLRFRASEFAWEHRRVIALSAAAALRQMEGEGWTYVAGWFPFHYLKRPARQG